MKSYYVYIISNWDSKVLYIGVTGNLEKRMFEHKSRLVAGFSQKYNLQKLVYFEVCSEPADAIRREKQLKNWNRKKKDRLVAIMNPEWRDLSEGWFKDSSTRLRSVGMTGEGGKV